MAALSLQLRGARPREEERLWNFYQANPADTLPVPSVTTIRNALRRGSLLIVEDARSDAIVATAGYFEYITSARRHIVFELAGTRVTKTIGRLLPIPLQQILLAVRLFQVVSTEDQIKRRLSVISSARHPRSQANLVALSMREIADMPRWMDYDTYSWAPLHEREAWRHYIAGDASIIEALGLLQQVGFEQGKLDCRAVRKGQDDASEQCDVALTYQLPIRALFRPLLDAQHRGETICALTELPDTL